MGKFQELLATLLPDAWAASLESESRAWRMRCPCGAETSIWDMGGIRWKAAGRPRRLGTCGTCGRKFIGAVYRNDPVVSPVVNETPPVAETISDTGERTTRAPGADRGRCFLWIDGVGCWQLHLKDRLSIGGPGSHTRSDRTADLQLLADLSRAHASLARSGETYLLAADGPTTVGGKLLAQPIVLRDGDLIGLGQAVRLRFRLPNPLSLTARLEFDSHHRPTRRIDGVLLLDQAGVLGPAADCHVVCPDWLRRIIIFRRDGKLWCKLGPLEPDAPAGETGDLYVNGCRVPDSAPLRDGSIVTLGDARFRIEIPASASDL